MVGLFSGCYTSEKVSAVSLEDVVSRREDGFRLAIEEVDFSLPFRFVDVVSKEVYSRGDSSYPDYNRVQTEVDIGALCYTMLSAIAKGDVNCNGTIDIEDLGYVASYVLSTDEEKNAALGCFFGCVQGYTAADVDCSGGITENDQYLMMLYWVSEGEGITMLQTGCWKEKEEF